LAEGFGLVVEVLWEAVPMAALLVFHVLCSKTQTGVLQVDTAPTPTNQPTDQRISPVTTSTRFQRTTTDLATNWLPS